MKNCKRIYEAQTASPFKEFIHTLLTHPHKIKSYYVSGKNFLTEIYGRDIFNSN